MAERLFNPHLDQNSYSTPASHWRAKCVNMGIDTMVRKTACLILALAAALAGAQGGLTGQPKLNPQLKPGIPLGDVKLTPAQAQQWSRMISQIKPQPINSALFILDTQYKSGFPEMAEAKTVYVSPAKTVTMLLRGEGWRSAARTLVLQIATEPSSFSLAEPYMGWEKPAGLVYSQDFRAAFNRQPKEPSHATLGWANLVPGSPQLGQVKYTAEALYAYLDLPLPIPQLAKTGTMFYARVVPILARDGKRTPIGPASNWVRFYVTVSESEHLQKIADGKEAAAKQAAAQKGQQLVTSANEAQKALQNAYEIRLLSYIPPKFADDPNAADHFLANRMVSFQYDKNTKATSINTNETYSLLEVRNLIGSNKTVGQELWEVLSATLNMTSSAYQAAKQFAVDTIAAGFDALPGINCDGQCKELLMTGLNFALAYCGIPPSIPNIDELYGRGSEYMAATLADMTLEQLAGVSIGDTGYEQLISASAREGARAAAKKGFQEMIDRFAKPAPFDQGAPETWGRPAPFFRRRPAMLYIEIRRKAGAPLPTGQAWQNLELGFSGEFFSIPTLALPRTIEGKLRIPIALATTRGPESWSVAGTMPDPGTDPFMRVGQPYYSDRGGVIVSLTSTHRLGKTGTAFKVAWASFNIDPARVYARPLPNKAIFAPGEMDAALEQPPVKAPDNYYGKIRLRWFSK
jgi:hypothetical protein